MTMLYTFIVAISQNVPAVTCFPHGQTRAWLRNIIAVNSSAIWVRARATQFMQLAAKQAPASSEFHFTASRLTYWFHKQKPCGSYEKKWDNVCKKTYMYLQHLWCFKNVPVYSTILYTVHKMSLGQHTVDIFVSKCCQNSI